MKGRVDPRLAWVAAIWAISVCLPVWMSRLHWTRAAVPAAEPGAGWSWLALPAGLAVRTDPLAGWSRLAGPAPLAREPAAAPPPAGPAEICGEAVARPSAQPFRIEVYGQVDEGGVPVYCFLDTESGRWFRLAAGGADARAGIALPETGGTDAPLLLDLRDGGRFSMQPGRRRPVPLASPEPLDPP